MMYLMILSEDEKYSNLFCLLHGDFTSVFSVAAVGNDLVQEGCYPN